MTSISRRNLVFSTTAAAAAFGLNGPLEFISPAAAQKAGSGSGSGTAPKVMGFKRFKIGDAEVTTIYDGIWEKAHDAAFIKNASIDDTKKALVAAKMTDAHVPIPFTVTVVKIKGKYTMFDSGTGGQVQPTAGLMMSQNMKAAGIDPAKISTIIVTHYHPDHIGGDLFGTSIEGIATLLEKKGVKIHAHRDEAQGVKYITGISDSDLALHDGSDQLMVGGIGITFVHTPGHTPGSQCFLVEGCLVSGDTLFVGGCGRVDLPGSDPEEMYRTLTGRLSKLPGETVLYPGHHYGPTPRSTLATERRTNHYLQVPDMETWLGMMG